MSEWVELKDAPRAIADCFKTPFSGPLKKKREILDVFASDMEKEPEEEDKDKPYK